MTPEKSDDIAASVRPAGSPGVEPSGAPRPTEQDETGPSIAGRFQVEGYRNG